MFSEGTKHDDGGFEWRVGLLRASGSIDYQAQNVRIARGAWYRR